MLQRASQHLARHALHCATEQPHGALTLGLLVCTPRSAGGRALLPAGHRWSTTDTTTSTTSTSTGSSSGSSGASSRTDAEGSQQEAVGTAPETYPAYDVSYKGSFCTPHKFLKQASLLNTFTSLAASPLVVMYAEMGLVGRVGLAITLSTFGLLTTGALHWFTKPYVHELNYTGSTGEVEVKTVNLFARLQSTKFHLSEVTFATALHPAVTFAAQGKPYFIEKNIFPDANLLDFLTPEDPALANAPRVKDDDEE